MKKLIALTIVSVSLAFHARAQEVVYDPIMNIEQILDETENLAKYAIMIENEEQQLTQLKDQLSEFKNFESQFGTPSSVTVSTGTSLSSDLQTSEPVQSLENIVSSADGTTALTSNDNGLYNTVGTSFQTPGGQTIERPADQYKKYAAVSDAANNFVTVADDTAQRRSTIKNAIAQTTEQLQGASSDAEVQKLHAVLNGPLFPYLRTVRAGDRATEFKQRCAGLGIKGVTLHSYRYAWAERAKTAGYPEQFAMENLGQNSKAVHRAYSRKAKVELPSLGEYERRRKEAARGVMAEPVAQAVIA